MRKTTLASVVIGLVASIVFLGCSGVSRAPEAEIAPVINELDGAPAWVVSPSFENQIVATGNSVNSDNNDFRIKRDEAINNAKSNLSEELNRKITNIIKSLKSTTSADELQSANETIEDAAKKITFSTMDSSKVVKLWKSQTGNIYVLITIKISIVKDEMEKLISNSFKNDEEIYQNFIMAKSNGTIDIELKNSNL